MTAATLSLLLLTSWAGAGASTAMAGGTALPPWWDSAHRVDPDRPTSPSENGNLAVVGRLSITPEAAERDARQALAAAVRRWLEPEVPADWVPPADLVERAIRGRHVQAVRNEHADDPAFAEFPDLYRGGLLVNLDAAQRALFLKAHREEVVTGRLWGLGLGLGFALICLLALAGYIRADESTRGYFTWPLRLVATAAVVGAGAAAYWLG